MTPRNIPEPVGPAPMIPEPVAGPTFLAEQRVWITWMTCAGDGWEHAVGDEQVADGCRRGTGRYRSVCGRLIMPGPLACPPGLRCPNCTAALPGPRPAPRRTVRWLDWLRISTRTT